jgi:hypothetical protein
MHGLQAAIRVVRNLALQIQEAAAEALLTAVRVVVPQVEAELSSSLTQLFLPSQA